MDVLVVPDKFKGTLTAQAAAESIATGWRKVRSTDHLVLLPMSDGGDGFGEVLSGLLGGELRSTRTIDAAHRSCEASWWWVGESSTAIIESARVIGLALLPPNRYHPFQLDTFGLGALVDAAIEAQSRELLVGIGGG